MDQYTVQWVCLPGGKASSDSVRLRLLAMYRQVQGGGDDSIWQDWPSTLHARADGFCIEVTSDPSHVPPPLVFSPGAITDVTEKSKYWNAIIGVANPSFKAQNVRVMQSSRSADACDLMQQKQRDAFRNLLPAQFQSLLPLYGPPTQPLHSRSKEDLANRMQAVASLRKDHDQWIEAQYYVSKLSDRPFDTLHSSILSGFQNRDDRSQVDRAYIMSDPRHAVLLFHGRAWADRSHAYLNTTNMARSDDDPDAIKPFVKRSVAEKLAILRNYPPLLESLALLFDIPFNIPESALQNKLIRAFPAHGMQKVEFGDSPWTQVGTNGFFPQSVRGEVEDGFLSISGAEYVLAGFEVDAAALRDVSRENYVFDQSATGHGTVDAQEHTSLPISGGVSLLRRDRVQAMTKRRSRFSSTQAFTAEHLLGSLEPQIWVKKHKREFLSLTERVESYHISDSLPDISTQTVSVGVRTAARKDPDGSLHPSAAAGIPYQVHDSIFRWDGWHLGSDHPLNPDKPEDPPVPLPFLVTRGTPSRVPGLRFGYTYQLRVRALDLAGFPMSDSDATVNVREYTHFRSDPVEPPMVLLSESLPAEDYPGETLETMVIRTTDSERFNTDFCTRIIVPPRVGLLFAERHAMFNEVSPFKTSSYSKVEFQKSEFVADPHSGLPIVAINDEYPDPPACTYLPDPMAKYICADLRWNGRSIELEGEQTIQICDEDSWPEADLVKVILSKADSVGGQWVSDHEGHTLRVWLPKGAKAELRLSCTMNEDDFDKHIAAKWAQDSHDPGGIREVVLAGQHPLVTPPRILALVHALEVPPDPPAVHVTAIQQTLNSPIANVRVSATADMRLVSSTDITAEWTDCSSDSKDLRGKTKVGTIYDKPQELDCSFPSTSYRDVGYIGLCSSRFAEYFYSAGHDARKGPPSAPTFGVPHLNTARPEAFDLAYVIPTFQTLSDDNSLTRPKRSFLQQRRGGTLRIFFRGQGCTSGPGEKLGVVIFNTSAPRDYALSRASREWSNEPQGNATGASAADYLAKTATYNSIWAGDNLWPSKVSTGGPAANDFLDPDSVVEGATLLELEGPEPSGEPRYPITLATYNPQFDPDRQLSWCDVGLTVPSSFAFLRLALVRYQPHSLRFADCSRVVYADYISLTPTRSLIVMRAPRTIRLKNEIFVFLLGDHDERSDDFANAYQVTLDRSEGLGRSGIWWRPLTNSSEVDIRTIPQETYGTLVSKQPSNPVLAAFSVRLLKRGGDLRLAIWETENYGADEHVRGRLIYADNLYIPDDSL